jgi:hypothetical protein
MSQDATETAAPAPAAIESPPAPQPPREDANDPRAKLQALASELMRSHNRRLVIEYLRLRRAMA